MASISRRIKHPVLFICDLQEKFRNPIYSFPSIVSTTQKLLRASAVLQIPIIATTQLRGKLGETCSELGLETTYPTAVHADKSKFSMFIPEVKSALRKLPQKADPAKDTSMKRHPYDIILVGIETHVCVLQTALDALDEGHRVWVVQDGVSSCNAEERSIALQRLRQEGVKVTTSESLLFEMIGDAEDDRFKQIAALIKETKDDTKANLQALCKI